MGSARDSASTDARIRWELYTARARLVIALAQSEARALGHGRIEVGHVLLGLVRERTGVAARLLRDAAVDAARLRAALGDGAALDTGRPVGGRIPFAGDVERALRAARGEPDGFVGTEHVLHALLHDADAARVLSAVDVDGVPLRAALATELAQPPRRRTGSAREPEDGVQVLAGLTEGALGLLAEADAAARRLGSEVIGTDHLLVAMLWARGLAAELLEAEGLTLDGVRAQLTSHPSPEPPARADASTSVVTLPCSQTLRRVVAMACAHAVIFESADIQTEHLLLAILVHRKGAAFDIVGQHDGGAGPRLRGALTDALGGPDGLVSPAPTDTVLEAMLLAWSLALALGYSQIQARHVLAGVSAPDWTIGARALAALGGPVPPETPRPSPARSNEPYRMIPFAPAVRQALRTAGAEARALNTSFLGTEHLVIGIAAAAGPELEAHVGRSAPVAAVRLAVADAVISAEAARAEEVRRHSQPPLPAMVSTHANAPAVTPQRRGRLLAAAREVAAADDPCADGADPGCWAGVVAAVTTNDDEELGELLTLLHLDPDELSRLGAGVDDLPLADGLERAEQRYGPAAGAAELIIAIVSVGSPRVHAAIFALGLTEAELVAQLAAWRAKREFDDVPATTLTGIMGVNLLFSMATSVLLLEVVISEGAWWKLALLPLVWSGHPGLGPVAGVGVGVLLGGVVSPLVGAVHVASIVVEVVQASMERQATWARTGVRITLRELRCVTRRAMNSTAAQVHQWWRQLLLATVRRWRPAAAILGGTRRG